MDQNDLNSRLSRISTIWTLLSDAHKALRTRAGDARLALIQRYQGAAYRYLLGAVRNPDAADELFQEFALRVMQGAFAHADPARGRFRSYLKTMLYHLVVDYQRRQRRLPRSLQSAMPEPAEQAWIRPRPTSGFCTVGGMRFWPAPGPHWPRPNAAAGSPSTAC